MIANSVKYRVPGSGSRFNPSNPSALLSAKIQLFTSFASLLISRQALSGDGSEKHTHQAPHLTLTLSADCSDWLLVVHHIPFINLWPLAFFWFALIRYVQLVLLQTEKCKSQTFNESIQTFGNCFVVLHVEIFAAKLGQHCFIFIVCSMQCRAFNTTAD